MLGPKLNTIKNCQTRMQNTQLNAYKSVVRLGYRFEWLRGTLKSGV